MVLRPQVLHHQEVKDALVAAIVNIHALLVLVETHKFGRCTLSGYNPWLHDNAHP